MRDRIRTYPDEPQTPKKTNPNDPSSSSPRPTTCVREPFRAFCFLVGSFSAGIILRSLIPYQPTTRKSISPKSSPNHTLPKQNTTCSIQQLMQTNGLYLRSILQMSSVDSRWPKAQSVEPCISTPTMMTAYPLKRLWPSILVISLNTPWTLKTTS